jgi:hypothetical protein
MEREAPPVACTLGQLDAAQRAERWRTLATGALAQGSTPQRGVRLVFDAGPGVADELQALAALERDCCAFADWSVRADGSQLTLEVTGDGAEAAAAIQSMFAELR